MGFPGLGGLGGLSKITSFAGGLKGIGSMGGGAGMFDPSKMNLSQDKINTLTTSGTALINDGLQLTQEPEFKDLIQNGLSGGMAFMSGDYGGAMQSAIAAGKDGIALAAKPETQDAVGQATTMGITGAQIVGPAFGAGDTFEKIDAQQTGQTVKGLYGTFAGYASQFAGSMG